MINPGSVPLLGFINYLLSKCCKSEYDEIINNLYQGVWATPRRNEDMLVEAFRHTKHVILIFSVRESGAFQGEIEIVNLE